MTSIDIYSILSSKPHNPHYLKRYYKFIIWCAQVNSTKTKEELGYTEKHHICPKAKDLFPEYSCFKKNPWNMVVLTLKQHIVAHHILWKAFQTPSQTYSFFCMTKVNNVCHPVSVASKLKLESAKSNSSYSKGRKMSLDARSLMSIANIGKILYTSPDLTESTFVMPHELPPENWIRGDKIRDRFGENNSFFNKRHTDTSKIQMSASAIGQNHGIVGERHHFFGKHHTLESRAKISSNISGEKHPNWGKHHSTETKEKMRNKKLGKAYSQDTRDLLSSQRVGFVTAFDLLLNIGVKITKDKFDKEKGSRYVGISSKIAKEHYRKTADKQ